MHSVLRRTAAAAFAIAGLVAATASQAITAWPNFQGDAAHTGYAPVRVDPTRFHVRWSVPLAETALSPATTSRGRVYLSVPGYFGTQSVLAVDAPTGATLWQKDYADVFSVNPPSVSGDTVYFQTGNHASDTYLHAVSGLDGTELWRAPHQAQWERYYAPTVDGTGIFVNGGSYGGLYGFRRGDGRQNWFLGLDQYDQWTPAVDATRVYAYAGPGGLRVVDRKTGEVQFAIADPNFNWSGYSMNGAPVLAPDGAVFAIQGGRLLRFNTQTQRLQWQKSASFTGQPALADGVVYAIQGGALVARDAATGAQRWKWVSPTGALTSNPIVTAGHVFIGDGSSTYCVDLASHQSVWQLARSGSLTLGYGMLFIAGGDGRLTSVYLFATDL